MLLLKKSIDKLFLMALNIDGNIEGRMTSPFKNDIGNLVNFHQSIFEFQK